jgi:adenine-specific DNA-methyltransferase
MQLGDHERRFARDLRKNQTLAEARIWYRLRGRRLSGLRFRRQHPIGPYFADFACLELGLVVELDGGQHSSAHGRSRDCTRSDVLAAHGFEVLRFWDNEALSNTAGVVEAIARRAAEIQRALGAS